MFLMAWAIPSGFAQEITITLVPGWNWISYPKAETMSIAMALGDFTPVHGDMIKSQSANISYINGQWRGSMEQFTPGRGYMYFSNRAETVSFIFAGTASLAVTTSNPTEVTSNSAICGGTAASNDGTAILMKGVCWATHPQPTTNDSYSENGNDSGPFTEEIVGLIPNTVYYVRAYAVSVKGVSYGEVVSFTTLDIGGGGDHVYVDLGLPSGTLWATCNVGAIFPEDYGDYFAWGETQPKEDFSYMWSTYQHCYGSYNTLTKYCTNASYGYNGFTDSQTTLLPEDDVATANWGTDWRMPTDEEWGELFYNTPYTWTTQYGIYGILFTASNGNSLFLPAAGYQGGSFLVPGGSDGYYWSSSLYSENPSRAMFFDFNYGTGDDNRAFGLSVRPVRSVQPSTTDYSITVISSPIVGGMVTGGGIYQQGQPCTVNAVAATGYAFTNWTENDSVVSANANYTFTVNSNRTLVANFSSQAPNTYTISVSSNPTNGGSVTGGGTYQQGQSCTVSATANSG